MQSHRTIRKENGIKLVFQTKEQNVFFSPLSFEFIVFVFYLHVGCCSGVNQVEKQACRMTVEGIGRQRLAFLFSWMKKFWQFYFCNGKKKQEKKSQTKMVQCFLFHFTNVCTLVKSFYNYGGFLYEKRIQELFLSVHRNV